MKFLIRRNKKIAALLLLILTMELVAPNFAYALTSGPTQPETQSFQPIGNSDMVDLFSGDFSYNIPLLDVGGYPVNLAYQSGASMDDEATWAGYGWNLNVGSLNRQLRGIPDDFNGTDKQEREMNMKDHVTKGGKFSMTLDLLGVPTKKIKLKKKKKRKLNLNLTISVGVKVDNYRGIGMDIGLNPGVSFTDYTAGENTKSNPDGSYDVDSLSKSTSPSILSGGLTLSSQDGATIDLNAAILKKNIVKNDKQYGLSSSIGFGYNSRAGLQGMTLGASFSKAKLDMFGEVKKKMYGKDFSSFISFNSESYTPTIDHATKNESFSFSLHPGPELWVALLGIGVSGFYSKQTVKGENKLSPAYGYLHSERANDDNDAMVDFNREKDIPFSKEVKYLPIPVPTYDLFSATSQDGSGQYRLYRGSSGVFFDQRIKNTSDAYTLGIEVGAGTYFDVGADLYKQDVNTISQKWTKRNKFLAKGDFQAASLINPLYEPAYFKRVGEPVPYDKDFVSVIKGTSPVAVSLPRSIGNAIEGAEASDKLRTKASPSGEATSTLKRNKREVRNTAFSYLTAKEAAQHGLDKTIKDLHPDSLVLNNCNSGGIRANIQRASEYRKQHHFSEITVTGDDGKRSVYGLPVYNTYQEEVSFSVPENLAMRNKGLIRYNHGTDNSRNNKNGRENYYSKEVTPAYATSYLLTGILSPDYVDVTRNGITDDDLGTAVKFNYSKLNGSYKWRTPFAFGQDTANYNEGFLSDPKDDKANYVYGEKEVWYLHSIESKTMVAHFITEDREDALGVTNNRGGVNTSVKLKRLKEIRLYSKSDLKLNGNDPSKTVPIKVVHLVHDYSLCKGLPNSINNTGKLTLKRVYFTFGQNEKGSLNPYDFVYDTSYNFYNYRQYDRWGNFKDVASNPSGLNNSEFPYTLQSAVTDQFASAWQLKKIILPSGGSINITYESDDYAFVQDRRASQMFLLNGIRNPGDSTGLADADYIYANLSDTVANNKELRERYFEGIQNLYFKFLLDLDGKGHKEFVPGYAELDLSTPPELIGDTIAKIKLKKIKDTNPIAKAGWQFIRSNLPKYAYPGSDNLDDDGTNLGKAIKALVAAFGSIKELIQGFEKRARKDKFSDKVDLSKSWVRLCSPDWKKKGGGLRVKRVDISDDWANMAGTTGAVTATYSQVYDYTTKDGKGNLISSGVASYEPLLGNDENPFRQPVRYKQSQFLALDNYYYIEEPFGESFFPAASVGYSKVTVKTIGSGDAETVDRTGVTISEFYTAKDYPTKIDVLTLEHRKPIFGKLFKLIGGVSSDVTGVSQGYSVELNDMHGKPKAVNIYNKSGQNISSVEYFYQSVNEKAEKKELRNDVKVIAADGIVSDGVIGMDVETFSDMRDEKVENLGVSVKISGGSGAILFFPLPFFFPGIGVNYDRRSFRSSSTVKIINRFAIQYKVKKTENGSSITSENLLWDAQTGNILLTKTQNEFEDPIYSFAYPAHWKYDGMAQAYKNIGTVLTDFSTGSDGQITNTSYNELLVPGDELIDVSSENKYWIINSPVSGNFQKRLIDAAGNIQQVNNLTVKLLRSGRRNMANTGIATIASLNNPIVGNKLDVSVLMKVLDAKATVFNEEWSVPVKKCTTCPQGYQLSADMLTCYKDTACIPATTYTVCAGDKNNAYSACGTYVYDCYDNSDNFTRSRFAPANPFWIGDSVYCGLSIATSSGSCGQQTLQQMTSSKTKNTGRRVVNNRSNVVTEISDSIPGKKKQANKSTGGEFQALAVEEFKGPLNRAGIWACNPNRPLNTWLGFSSTFYTSQAKTYYIGIGGDNHFRVKIDNNLFAQDTLTNLENFRVWHLFPVYLDSGTHTIVMEGRDLGVAAAFGAEIYDNTLSQLDTASSYNSINLIFSTKNMVGQQFQVGDATCPTGYTKIAQDSSCLCRKIDQTKTNEFNPYYTGILGNWRPKSQYVYQVKRENLVGDPNKFGSTNIRKSGAYNIFNPFWSYSSQQWQQNSTSDARWIAANEMTYFNRKGLELENKDALDRYSAALFGYLESMPVAVASNSRYREVAYDGFEDYGFTLDCSSADTCNPGHFNFRKNLNGSSIDTTSSYAHSGKYSLKLNGTTTIAKTVYTNTTAGIFSFDNSGRYILTSNELAKGFSPIPGKKYVLSFWVKDASPRNPSTTVQAAINGASLIDGLSKWPVVEGWKRVEVPFLLPSSAASFNLQLQSGGGDVFIDDLRIHPFDGQMKSFAYDPSSQRLWAELDENNFAAFYEYDDEGTLVRVKKETERGIMTIKETRSGYRKR
ncbi:hypothetical protein [Terrimonas alba]|uniref:hypothetical protein n=1 Tax=Terrimonas alba TaxID=3349636 RepID=UPI0035F4767E